MTVLQPQLDDTGADEQMLAAELSGGGVSGQRFRSVHSEEKR